MFNTDCSETFRKDDYAFFLRPVDVTQVPTYLEVVKEPMDFGTMTTKVEEGRYRSLDEFTVSSELWVLSCLWSGLPDTARGRVIGVDTARSRPCDGLAQQWRRRVLMHCASFETIAAPSAPILSGRCRYLRPHDHITFRLALAKPDSAAPISLKAALNSTEIIRDSAEEKKKVVVTIIFSIPGCIA